jgi:membrane protein DedA with SNARE-associated domain
MWVQELDLSSPVAFLVAGGLALVDGVIPLVPARTALIGIGVIAGTGDLRAYPLLAVATCAAFLSDNLSYCFGHHLWPRISPHVLRTDRARRLWSWVEQKMATHGTVLLAFARVIPGGPTPITLTAGSVRFPMRRFQAASAASALIWSTWAFGVGFVGEAVTGRPLFGLVVGIVLAGAVTVVLRRGVNLRRLRNTSAAKELDADPGRPDGDLHRDFTPT